MTTWATETDDSASWTSQQTAQGDTYVANGYVVRGYIETDEWTELEQVTTWQSL